MDQFADPEAFALQCAVLFEKYEIEAVEYLTDVRNSGSLQIRYSWPPTLQQISEALELETVRRDKLRKSQYQPKPSRYVPPEIPSHPGCRCNILVHFDAPQYAALKAWSETPESDVRDYMEDACGLRVSTTVWNQLGMGKLVPANWWRVASDSELRAYYGKREAEASNARVHEGTKAE